ncbi:MAG: hypothetical protein COX19_11550 [Desulfobacterales bacterium CG23_combo_of_CG06-09_8_20_14_all_51_8]|nr:MAG: hypothetical protein COX19_11550 [Desulfobacterales bacterium CG23_combo_of_CG06-09_8_20_14_all_51_8]
MISQKKNRIYLNGSDCIMLAFDYQMRRLGAPGNMGQIILGLSSRFSETDFRNQISLVKKRFPIINAVLKRGLFNRIPYWEVDADSGLPYPQVKTHDLEKSTGPATLKALKRDILNQPMNIKKGELVRFDLIYTAGGCMKVIMTWAHVLMDAHGAESFLAIVGGSLMGKTDFNPTNNLMSGGYKNRFFDPPSSPPKWQDAKKFFNRIDNIASAPPVSLYTKYKQKIKPRLDYQIISFDLDETKYLLDLAEKNCGFLNESEYFISSVMGEFHNVCCAKGLDSPSYVVPLSVDLRKKGTRLPVFSNQFATLLYSFKPENLLCRESIIEAFKIQTQDAFRNNLIFANLCALEFSRFLPSWLYARKVRQTLKGEIASIVIANPGKSLSDLSTFMGIPVSYQHHVPTVVIPPGIGVVFYTYSGKLFITLAYLEGMISPVEADEFLQKIRSHLLHRD